MILVTGASGFLGKAIAEKLIHDDLDLYLTDLDIDSLVLLRLELLSLKPEVKIVIQSTDLANENDRLQLFESIENSGAELSGLVNNAAAVGSSYLAGWSASFLEQEVGVFRDSLDVNLVAPFHLSQLFAKHVAHRDGVIVNISSIYGSMAPDWSMYEGTSMGNPAGYAIAKAGINQLTKWMATSVGANIRVNAVAPGGIERGQPTEFVSKYVSRTPLKRMCTETDVVKLVRFLLSDDSAYMTGEILTVDGGRSLL